MYKKDSWLSVQNTSLHEISWAKNKRKVHTEIFEILGYDFWVIMITVFHEEAFYDGAGSQIKIFDDACIGLSKKFVWLCNWTIEMRFASICVQVESVKKNIE